MQLVDQPGAKILTHRLDATTDLHVAAFGRELRLLQRSLDTVGHEDEGGAAVHLDRIAGELAELIIEYDPHPPFGTGAATNAPKPLVDTFEGLLDEMIGHYRKGAVDVFANQSIRQAAT